MSKEELNQMKEEIRAEFLRANMAEGNLSFGVVGSLVHGFDQGFNACAKILMSKINGSKKEHNE